MLKNTGAILAGFVIVFILSTLTDFILEQTGFFPSVADQIKYSPETWLLVTALAYRSVYTVLGGFITAKLSTTKPMKNVVILGIIGTILAVIGTIAGWNLSAHWYPIALAITAFPLVYIGGRLQIRNK